VIKKIASFLRLLDEDGKLNIADLAFMIILTKVALSSNIDWPSMVVLMTTCLNSMHQRHVDAKDDPALLELIQHQTNSIREIQEKVNPILDSLRGKS
jgi:hypothetical protein